MNVEELKITSSAEYLTLVVQLDCFDKTTSDKICDWVQDRFELNNDNSDSITVVCVDIEDLGNGTRQFLFEVTTHYKEAIYYVRGS